MVSVFRAKILFRSHTSYKVILGGTDNELPYQTLGEVGDHGEVTPGTIWIAPAKIDHSGRASVFLRTRSAARRSNGTVLYFTKSEIKNSL